MSVVPQEKPPLVLVIDDEPDMVHIYNDMLHHAGYSVLSAHEGTTAIALARTHLPDIILLDIMMPNISGLDLLPKFKSLDPEVQVIMLTVLDESSSATRAIREGAFAYLVKSVHLDEVLDSVKDAWRTRKCHTRRCFGALCLDLRTKTASVNGAPLALSEIEWRFLNYLAHNQEGASYEDIWHAVWEESPPCDRDLIQRTVDALRQKMDLNHIQAVREDGYRLE